MVTTAKRREEAPQAPGNVERLRKLYELSMTLCGDPAEVFARIAPMIGELLEVPIVCLSRIVGDELHFLSVYDRGNVVSNAGRYPLSVTPCATVERTRDIRTYDRVAERFPDATFLKDNNAVSYCGFPSLDNDEKVIAVTCLLDDRPHDFTPGDRDLLRVFGQRIGMEIERQKHLEERDRVVSALDEAEAKYRRNVEPTEAALQASQARFAGILDIAQEAVVSVDETHRIQIFNKGAERIFGYAAGEIIGQPLDRLMPARFRAAHGKHIDGFARAPEVSRLMNRRGQIIGLRKGGSEFPAEASVSKLELGGQVTFTVMLRDITGRQMAENALRESEERFRDFAATASDWFWEMDENLRFTYFSNRYGHSGPGSDKRIGKTRAEATAEDTDQPKWREHLADLEARRPFKNFEHSSKARDGSLVHVAASGTPHFDEAGNFKGYRGTGTDITERKRAEQALKENEERLSQAAKLARLGHWIWDEKQNCVERFSPELARIFGLGDDAAIVSFADFLAYVHSDDRHLVETVIQQARRDGSGFEIEYRIKDRDGATRHVVERSQPVPDETGELVRSVSTIQDITETKQAEEQLRHAQKLEAVGLLTGGVAHDFNNLLAVILGHAELLEDRLGADDPSVRAVIRTAMRGAELTQRLLAFSRRQSLEPEVMDLDVLIAAMTELLRRTLGKTIEIEFTSETEPWQTLADPGQVENALLNLAINARDAMPGGGRLTIATDNVTLDASGAAGHADASPGDYVRITVTDTGTGMSSEVLERALEPFFTTKGVGEGSGLGLPMVYGFAKQSGGFVSIRSESSRGTTVALYLPRAKKPDRRAGDRRELR